MTLHDLVQGNDVVTLLPSSHALSHILNDTGWLVGFSEGERCSVDSI